MIPNNAKQAYFQASTDFENDDLRVGLLDDSTAYSPDPAAHETVADITDDAEGTEYSDTNYSRQSLTNPSATQNDTDNRGEFSADDTTFPSLGSSDGATIQAVFLYRHDSDSDDSQNPLLRVVDDSEDDSLPQATNGSDITLEWDATAGITYIGPEP